MRNTIRFKKIKAGFYVVNHKGGQVFIWDKKTHWQVVHPRNSCYVRNFRQAKTAVLLILRGKTPPSIILWDGVKMKSMHHSVLILPCLHLFKLTTLIKGKWNTQYCNSYQQAREMA